MAQIRLISLYCEETEDLTGSDEVKIVIDGDTVYTTSINDRQSKKIDKLVPMKSMESRIELLERDVGGPDDDDYLGSVSVGMNKLNAGSQDHWFKRFGASYRLTYEVVS
jgi:hypothetical protein